MSDQPEKIIRTGIRDLDTLLDGGLRPGITTISGRTSSGKTMLALMIAEYASREGLDNAPARTLIMSTEGTGSMITPYFISNKARVDRNQLEKLHITVTQLERVKVAVEEINTVHKLDVLPERSLNLAYFRGIAAGHVDLFVFDNLRVKDDEEGRAFLDELERLAIQRDICLLVTQTIWSGKFDAEERTDKHPTLFDVESPALVQRSRTVLLLHRDELYAPRPQYGEERDVNRAAEIIVAKNRHGNTGTVHTFFFPEISRFEGID